MSAKESESHTDSDDREMVVRMVGRDLSHICEKYEVLCSVSGTVPDNLTMCCATKAGKVIIAHCQSRQMLLAPIQHPIRPSANHSHSRVAHHVPSHAREEVKVLKNNISRHCNELNGLDFFDIHASSMAYLMSSEEHEELYVIADSKANHLKIVNVEEWTLHHVIGSKGTKEGEFQGITGVAAFSTQSETYICVCEAVNNRVQILTHSGKPIASIGTNTTKGGHQRGQFRNPVSIAAHLPTGIFYRKQLYEGDFEPDWYLGVCSKDALEDELFADRPRPGLFFVGKQSSDSNIYDLVFLNESMKVSHRTIKRVVGSTEQSSSKDKSITYMYRMSNDQLHSYRCILDLVRAQRYLLRPRDIRPYALVAVADQANNRVQVFRFFWLSSDAYAPTLEFAAMIGGNQRSIVGLSAPLGVAYSPTGELFIIDSQNINTFSGKYTHSRPMNMLHMISPTMKLSCSFAAPTYIAPEEVLPLHDAADKRKADKRMLTSSQAPTASAVASASASASALPPIGGQSKVPPAQDGSKAATGLSSDAAFFLPPIHTALPPPSPQLVEESDGHGSLLSASHHHSSNAQAQVLAIHSSDGFEHSISHAVEDAMHAMDEPSYVGTNANATADSTADATTSTVASTASNSTAIDPSQFFALSLSLSLAAPSEATADAAAANADKRELMSVDTLLAHQAAEEQAKKGTSAAHIEPVVTCCSLCFSHRGHAVLGYINGGTVVFEPYKMFAMGAFAMFEEHILLRIVSYTNYFDCCQLRSSCRYLHNVTQSLRWQWQLPPMRRSVLQHALHLFLKYARVHSGLSCLESGLCLLDEQGRTMCRRHLELRCEGIGCANSHRSAVLDIDGIAAHRGYLEKDSVLVAVTQIYGAKYIWSVEKFVDVLFERLCITVPLIFRKTATELKDRCVPLRIEEENYTKVLSVLGFRELVCILEEDFTDCKPIYHCEFFVKLAKKALSSMRDPYDKHSVDKRMYVSPIEQYNKGIEIPVHAIRLKKPKARSYEVVELSSADIQGIEGDAVRNHVANVEAQSLRLSSLVNKLFN